jgi:hypothetical protein
MSNQTGSRLGGAAEAQFKYGTRVLCTDPHSPWFGGAGVIVGKNRGSLGIHFDRDPDPPATGRWIAKGHVRLPGAPGAAKPWLGAICIHNNYVHRNLRIPIDGSAPQPSHLVLTGRNASGKSATLRLLWEELIHGHWGGRFAQLRGQAPEQAEEASRALLGGQPCVEPEFQDDLLDVSTERAAGRLLGAFLSPTRRLETEIVRGPSAIDWRDTRLKQDAARLMMQHLVNRRTAQAFASERGQTRQYHELQSWFESLTGIFRRLLDEPRLELVFNSDQFRFDFRLGTGSLTPFEHLPDGYASLLKIWAELELGLEAARETHPEVSNWTGIALIDEIEAHLHLELQESVFPVLTQLFPQFQFIVSTHSPAVLASVGNATVFDLSTRQSIRGSSLRGRALQAMTWLDTPIEASWLTPRRTGWAVQRQIHRVVLLARRGLAASSKELPWDAGNAVTIQPIAGGGIERDLLRGYARS